MVAIDTDVLVLAFAFHHDPRQEINRSFLAAVRPQTPLVAIYSVMELLGQLSFNLSSERLAQWQSWLQDHYLPVIGHGFAALNLPMLSRMCPCTAARTVACSVTMTK